MNYAIACSNEQQLILDKLKSLGVEVVQSSSGLVCKSNLSVEKLISETAPLSCVISEMTASDIANQSPDIKKFLESK